MTDTERARYEDAKRTHAELMKVYPFTLDNLDGEIWADIFGYEGHYQISTFGRVKSFKKGREKILMPFIDKDGYLQVAFFKVGKYKKFKVHRLVALAFIPNPDDKPQINHRDGCKLNNFAGNLEWCTGSENIQHAFDIGLKKALQGEDNSQAKLTNTQVLYIRANPDNLSQKQLGEIFSVNSGSISEIQLGKHFKQVGGTIREAQKCSPRLPEEIVIYIRENPDKLSMKELAAKFNVNFSIISNIQVGISYKNVGGTIRKVKRPPVPKEIRTKIRAEYQKGVAGCGARALAKKYGINTATIFRIVKEKSAENRA